MIRITLLAAVAAAGFGQSLPRLEIDVGGWRSSVVGSVQAGALPVDLKSDLALRDRTLFLGTAMIRVGKRHRIVVEGSPIQFEGRNVLERTILYNQRTYAISEDVESRTDLTYLFVGHQWDFVAGESGRLGLRTGGAYLGASGAIRSGTTGASADRSYRIGIPLVGMHAQVLPIARRLEVFGGVQGMPLGRYGHYVQANGGAGVLFGPVGIRAGYRIIDADVHEANASAADRAGVAPRIAGPAVSLVVRIP